MENLRLDSRRKKKEKSQEWILKNAYCGSKGLEWTLNERLEWGLLKKAF